MMMQSIQKSFDKSKDGLNCVDMLNPIPIIFGLRTSLTLSGLTDPPYWMMILLARSWPYFFASTDRMNACTSWATAAGHTSPINDGEQSNQKQELIDELINQIIKQSINQTIKQSNNQSVNLSPTDFDVSSDVLVCG